MIDLAFAGDGTQPRSARIMPFLALTFGLSWTIWIAAWLLAGKPDTLQSVPMLVAVYAGSFGPGLAGAWLSWRAGTLREWLGGFARVRIGWRAVAAIALALPLVTLLLTLALGYRPIPQEGIAPELYYLTLFPAVVLNGAVTAVLGAGPLGEEGGWRGYLLPRLLERSGEVPASILLGLIWSAWHLPVMAMLPDWRSGLSFGFYLPAYTVTVMGLSLLMTRIWLLSGRSTLAAVWMHGLINALGGIAFNSKLWASQWSGQFNLLHFTAAVWIAAIVLLALRGKRAA